MTPLLASGVFRMRTVVFLVAVLMGLAIGGAIGQVDKHSRATEAKAQERIIQELVTPEIVGAHAVQ